MMEKIFKNQPFDKKIICACSGGADSIYLAFLLKKYARESETHALIVNHNLRKYSREEAQKTLIELKRIGYKKIAILEWEHENLYSGIEEKARAARFELIFSYAETESIKDIYLGHHAGDLIENFFLKMGSGAGIFGLCGLKKEKMIKWNNKNFKLLRPLLDIEKEEILLKIKEEGLNFIEDESNISATFKRNRIRKNLPEALCGLELSKKNIYSSIEALRKALKVLEKHNREIFDKTFSLNIHYGFFYSTYSACQTLLAEELFFILKEIIFFFTDEEARGKSIENACNRIFDKKGFTLAGIEGFWQQEKFYIVREAAKIKDFVLEEENAKEICWDRRFKIFNLQQGDCVKKINFSIYKYKDLNLPAKIIKTLPSVWRGETLIAFPQFHFPGFENIEFKSLTV